MKKRKRCEVARSKARVVMKLLTLKVMCWHLCYVNFKLRLRKLNMYSYCHFVMVLV